MRKIYKNITIALIFMLIGMLCQDLAYGLRVPVGINEDREEALISSVSKGSGRKSCIIEGNFLNPVVIERLKDIARVNLIVTDGKESAEYTAARKIADLIKSKNKTGEKAMIGFATGGTQGGIFEKLIKITKEEGISWLNVVTFNLDEYVWKAPGYPERYFREYYNRRSYRKFMQDKLFDWMVENAGLKKENIHLMDGLTENPEEEVRSYEKLIMEETNGNGVDLQVLGIGVEAHIGFIEARKRMLLKNFLKLRTKVEELARSTKEANSRFFDNIIDAVPAYAMTQGIATILSAKELLLVGTGSTKAEAIVKTVTGDVSPSAPASVLQLHKNATIIVDKEAAKGLIEQASKLAFDSIKRIQGGVVLYGPDGIKAEKVNKCSLPAGSRILVIERELGQHTPHSSNTLHMLQAGRLRNEVEVITLNKGMEALEKKLTQFNPYLVIAPIGDTEIENAVKQYAKRTVSGLHALYYDHFRKDSALNCFYFFNQEDLKQSLFALSAHKTQIRRTDFIKVTEFLSRYATGLAKYLGWNVPENAVAANPFIAAQVDKKGELAAASEGHRAIDITPSDIVYFVSPHPDDIEIAASGLVIDLLRRNIKVHNIVMNLDKWGVIPTPEEAATIGNLEERGELRRPEVMLSAERFGQGLTVDILNLKISEQDPGSANDDVNNPEFEEDLLKVKRYVEEAFEAYYASNPDKQGRMKFIIPYIEDSHPHHRIAYKVFVKVLQDLAKEKSIVIDVLFYLAPWAGGFDTYFLSQANVASGSASADLRDQIKVAELYMQGFSYLVGELAGGFGSKSPAPEDLGGVFAERFKRAYYPGNGDLIPVPKTATTSSL